MSMKLLKEAFANWRTPLFFDDILFEDELRDQAQGSRETETELFSNAFPTAQSRHFLGSQ